MSLRQVLTIYNAERQLSDDETALLNTLRKMTDAERGMFVDGLTDKSQKKDGKKGASKSSGKSARASGMAAQLNKSLQQRQTATDDSDSKTRCAHCMYTADSNIHHLPTTESYHAFEPLQPATDTARAAAGE